MRAALDDGAGFAEGVEVGGGGECDGAVAGVEGGVGVGGTGTGVGVQVMSARRRRDSWSTFRRWAAERAELLYQTGRLPRPGGEMPGDY
jgi:hypothetical protein